MICPKCAAEVTGGVSTCPSCGEPIPDPSSQPVNTHLPSVAMPRVAYAGFWWRALAFLIDLVIFCFAAAILVLIPMLKHAGLPLDNPWALANLRNRQVLAINLAVIMAMWLYWAVMESSVWQGTPGKRVLGIYVTDLAGKRITFARACGRFFAGRGISFIPFVGTFYYLTDCAMAGFTLRKQAVHDAIAGCLVLRIVGGRRREPAR